LPYKYIEYDPKTKLEASHLCGKHDCINPKHLHLEDHLTNQSRDCCHRYGWKKGYFCPHDPPCLNVTPIPK
jgi:hypothetical protein